MTDAKVREEMLADAFADFKTGRRILEEMADKKPTLAEKVVAFTKKVIDCAKKFFSDKSVQEKFPSVKLSDSQFKNFVERIDATAKNVKLNNVAEMSKGEKILTGNFHSPFAYKPELQKNFDLKVAKILLQKFQPVTVAQTIYNNSPLAKKIKNYASKVVHSVSPTYSR